MPVVRKSTPSKRHTGSQPNPCILVPSQSTHSSRNNSPIRSGIAQKATGAFIRPARQTQSANTVQNDKGTEVPVTPSNDKPGPPAKSGAHLLAELQGCSCSVEGILRELTPRKSETSPTRWANLCESKTPISGQSDDNESKTPISGQSDDKKGKAPISGQKTIIPTVESRYDLRKEAGPSGSQAPSDSDAITKAPYLAEVPADDFGKPIDMVKKPPPNEYTKAFLSSKLIPVPQVIQDELFAYPGPVLTKCAGAYATTNRTYAKKRKDQIAYTIWV
ncbi:uncharacterized protein DFL_008694 [Arthrobotrys flagrans]|uniref:Uncharacterized protein n=1 Tax=Arthrobotrys flagrans TaxID=97331 RepID=A0A436ZPP3_ARTFL|nr:hypothetical protein DFL_008694 [Arthrobotrys flagrans]